MENQEDQRHLDETIEQLHEALGQATALLGAIDDSYHDAKFYLAENRGNIDPQEMQQGHLALAEVDRRTSVAASSKARLEKQLESPYFARVDFQQKDADEPVSHYIGQFAFNRNGASVISDWRSPVAGLFYDFELGPAAYEAPAGLLEGDLVRKRQFRVEDGRLVYGIDSESNVRDEVLQLELSRTSSSRMRTIVSSIQREQNAIIRDEQPGTLVIQGVAGSGKTSIALHRIAYLLYRQKENLSSNAVAILSPNPVFGDYISGVLPELGEEPLHEYSLFGLAVMLLEGTAEVEAPRSFVDDQDADWHIRAQYKGTREFADLVSDYLRDAAPRIFQATDLEIGSRTMKADWLDARYRSYDNLPVKERLDLLAKDALSEATAGTFGRNRLAPPQRREVRTRLNRMLTIKNPLALYRRFFADCGRSDLFRPPASGTIEWEDAFPLILFRETFVGNDEQRGIRHLIIDEMQDLTPLQHRLMAKLFPCDKTILGDCNQLVDEHEEMAVEDIAAFYPAARTASLMRSYRSTYEITSLARRVKDIPSLEAVERHGDEPRFVRCANTADILAKVSRCIDEFDDSDHRTLGIIHRSETLASRYAEVIAHEHDINHITENSVSFPEGVTVCSVKMAKGLEFDEVILLDADNSQYTTHSDRNLLYVAITRAMHKLTVLYRNQPSELFSA